MLQYIQVFKIIQRQLANITAETVNINNRIHSVIIAKQKETAATKRTQFDTEIDGFGSQEAKQNVAILFEK